MSLHTIKLLCVCLIINALCGYLNKFKVRLKVRCPCTLAEVTRYDAAGPGPALFHKLRHVDTAALQCLSLTYIYKLAKVATNTKINLIILRPWIIYSHIIYANF